MLKSFAFLALLSTIPMLARDSPKSIALTDESNLPSNDILRALQKECPNVSITNDAHRSNYTLKARKKTNSKSIEENGFDLILFDRDGKIVLSTSNLLLDNAVKNVCRVVNESGKKK